MNEENLKMVIRSNLLNSSWIPSSRSWVTSIAWTNIIVGIAFVIPLFIEMAKEFKVFDSYPDVSHIVHFLILKTFYVMDNAITAGMGILLLIGVRERYLMILEAWLIATSILAILELLIVIVTPVVAISLDKADLVGLFRWEAPWWIAHLCSLIIVNKYKNSVEKEIDGFNFKFP